jgi:hypothetical protein
MALDKITAILKTCLTDQPLVPATLLYNEGWLLRLTLEWFSAHAAPNHPFSFPPGARWFSEGIVPSAFLHRFRGDRLGESSTRLAGAIGHFAIGGAGKTDLALAPNATHFVAIEAKLFSGLASGVKNAPYYDQAARTVACMAEVLKRANRSPSEMALGFYLVAPRLRLEQGAFAQQVSRDSIRRTVEKRVGEYKGDQDQWHARWFLPMLERMTIGTQSWEEILAVIEKQDAPAASLLKEFYRHCLTFNSGPGAPG